MSQTLPAGPARSNCFYALLASATLLLGCATGDEAPAPSLDSENDVAIAETTQELFGTQRSIDCSAAQQRFLQQSMFLGRTIANSNAFAECLDRAMRYGGVTGDDGEVGPYEPCRAGNIPLDPYGGSAIATQVARAVEATRNPLDIYIMCSDANRAEVGLSGLVPREVVEIGNVGGISSSSSQKTFQSKSKMIWHEAMHQQGYRHGTDNPSQCLQSDWGTNLPYIVQGCMAYVSNNSAERCGSVSCPGGYLPVNSALLASSTCMCQRDSTAHTPVLGNGATNVQFGASMAAGNFDGDEYDDLAVGAPLEASNTGAVYVYRGSEFGLIPWKVLRGAAQSAFGSSLAAGDLDGDGFDELAVGAPATQGAGFVHLYRGNSASGPVFNRKLGQTGLDADEEEDDFGFRVAIGNIFGSSRPGLIVTAQGEKFGTSSQGVIQTGAAFAFEGVSSGALVTPRYVLTPSEVSTNTASARFGLSVALRDFTGDGNEDILIGAPGAFAGVGRVYAFSGTAASATSSKRIGQLVPPPSVTSAFFGYAVAIAKVGAAGALRLAVSAPLWSNATGFAFLYEVTAAAPNGDFGIMREGMSGNGTSSFGMSMKVIQLDEGEQLVVGAPREAGHGRIRLFKPAPTNVAFAWFADQSAFEANEANDSFGSELAVGDFDFDGKQDLVVSAINEAFRTLPTTGVAYHWNGDGKGNFKPFRWYHKDM